MQPASATKPQPLSAEQVKSLLHRVVAELDHEPSMTEKIKLGMIVDHLYEKKLCVLVYWPR